ncbi:PKD domain-containing protein [Streptomyces sp. NPDC001795]|uniref:PKD domain-containing protein n=1 Tax=Streptomyces sp. NPDC001795 TaxID=3154525 RepID=UPI0033205BA6
MHRPRPAVGLPLAVIVVAGVVSGWGTGLAVADPGAAGTLYVNRDVACSDSGAGTQSMPFCTVQAAADVVEPGQTVRIESSGNSTYSGSVTLTRSGTKDAPITFTGAPLGTGGSWAELGPTGSAPALTLKGVHDVRVESLGVRYSGGDAVSVTGSEGVTLDRLSFRRSLVADSGGRGTAVTVDGASSDVIVSRNWISSGYAYGVRVEPGAARVTATTNVVTTPRQGGIVATGTSGADVTSNTVTAPCATGISLDGGSSGALENNVVVSTGAQQSATCPAPTAPLYAVSADSAGQVTGDYNVAANGIGPSARPRPEYSWADAPYATTAALRDATGQGAHDIDGLNAPSALTAPYEHSPFIDSADADAPGELTTDINGAPRVDDPLVADTGTGTTTHPDRGAVERQDTIAVPADDMPSPASGVAPFVTSVRTDDATTSWGKPVTTYSVDFGDGSAPVTAAAGPPITHTYATPGTYAATITVTDIDGSSHSVRPQVVAGTATPPATSLSGAAVTNSHGQVAAGDALFTVPEPANAWEVVGRTLAYGDGTQDNLAGGAQQVEHQYPAPGTYTATLTQTDLLGRTTTAKATFNAADAFLPITPQYDTQKTIPAHGVLKLSAATVKADSDGVDAAQLQIVAGAAKASGSLTLYTDGTTRPGTSTISFEPGRTATNEATVKVTPTGSVDLYNGSSGPVTVNVATIGLQSHTQFGRTYHPATPVRLLDTGAVAGGHSVTLAVSGTHGVPADANAVVLNVAATTTKGSGSLTVSPNGTINSGVTGPYWTTGQSASGQIVLPMIPLTDGKVVLHNSSRSSANLVADLVGWYGPSASGSGFQPVSPVRILNTRTGTGTTGGKIARLGARATLKLKVTGAHGVPASGVNAVDLNLTVPSPSGSGFLVAYADGTSRPGVHSVDFTAGHAVANRALVKVGTDGEIDLYNAGSTSVDVYADLLGDYDVCPVG